MQYVIVAKKNGGKFVTKTADTMGLDYYIKQMENQGEEILFVVGGETLMEAMERSFPVAEIYGIERNAL